MTRTGFIEWPAHQFGGSTFVTVGACAAQADAAAQAKAIDSKRRAVDVRTVLISIRRRAPHGWRLTPMALTLKGGAASNR
jgi:hypothetical protein